jgi:hypothetical protein
MATTTEQLPLALVPAWRRPVFWLLFALGAWWGTIIGSAAVAHPFLWQILVPSATRPQYGTAIHDAVVPPLVAASGTQPGATAIVWTFALGSGLVLACGGLRWLRRREPGGSWSRGEE